VKTVIKDVQPRKLIVLSGSTQAKEHLKNHCITNEICADVVIPASNQTISVTSESNLYRVNLKDTLLQQLQFVQVSEEYEVAYLEGQIKLNYQQANLPILQQTNDHKGECTDWQAECKLVVMWKWSRIVALLNSVLVDLSAHFFCSGHAAVFLGQVRPAELQQILQNDGIQVSTMDQATVRLDSSIQPRNADVGLCRCSLFCSVSWLAVCWCAMVGMSMCTR
jgi:hypothetical protein